MDDLDRSPKHRWDQSYEYHPGDGSIARPRPWRCIRDWRLNRFQIGFVTSLLEKTTLYSQMTVFVIPTRATALYLSYSAPGWIRIEDFNSIRQILSYNKQYESLVNAGKCVFLPSETINREESSGRHAIRRNWAPLVQDPDDLLYTPVNTARQPLTSIGPRSVYRDLLIYKTLVLPYFPNIDLGTVAKIAEDETDAFIRFNHFVSSRLTQLAAADSGRQLTEILDEIDYGVAGLRIEAEKVGKSRVLRGVGIGFFTISLAALAFVNHDVVREIAGVTGSVNLLELLRETVTIQKERLELKKSDFYVPYLLATSDS